MLGRSVGTSTAKAAMDQADAAYKMAIADQKVKDDSVRAKDAAEAENRLLKNEIASLNGTVTNKNTDNPGTVDNPDQLAKRKFSFAIYDASGYKGEAVATEYHASENAITCTLMLTKGEIKSGDLAATKTP